MRLIGFNVSKRSVMGFLVRRLPPACGALLVKGVVVALVVAFYSVHCRVTDSCVPLENIVRGIVEWMPSHKLIEYGYTESITGTHPPGSE